MEKNPTSLLVVAAVIRNGDGRLLLQQAQLGKPHAGQWEFPGGKVETGENPRFALLREIGEELGLMLDPSAMAPAGFADDPGQGDQSAIVLILYDCPTWDGEPQSREGQEWGWFTPAEASALPMAAIDRALLNGLR
ncbi:MAG TPA: (deoxy)nucleoside triphosphate pyrophosphohydrolase [Croceibacterium sp.]|nr:(deoxy)nucleoside triphosphate pyrophosphohydrolase [Croceibacterium sp.]